MRRRHVLAPVWFILACAPPPGEQALALRMAVAGDLAPFGPRVSTSFTASAADLVYQPILRVGADGQILAGAVRAWERLDRDRVRVQVDPDRRFSDGSPVSAEDLLASMSGLGLDLRPEGDWVEVRPGSSRNPLEVTLLYTAVFKEATPVPLGTGPFRHLESDGRRIVLERVRPEPGRIGRVEVLAARTPRDAFAWALRGEANAVLSLDERQSELIAGVPGLRLVRGASPHAVAVVMNAARLSRQERLGLAASLPLAELVRAYGEGCAPVRDSAARDSLPPGRTLEVIAATYDAGLPRMALALRRALGPRGGEVDMETVLGSTRRMSAGDYDLAVSGLLAWPPIMLGGLVRTGALMNWTAYSNPRVDAAIDRGDLEGASTEMERDPTLVFVCRRQRIAAVDARIRNATLGHWGLLETLPDWEVGP